MVFIIIIYIFFFIVVIILFLINFLVYYKNLFNREKNSSFECGFDKISSSRLPFSIQFFIICLLFLIFDIEITLIIPIIIGFNDFNLYYLIIIFLIFLIILIFGIILEWLDNSFNWII